MSCLQDCELCPDHSLTLLTGRDIGARRTDLIFDWSTKYVGPQIFKRVNDRQGTILLDL